MTENTNVTAYVKNDVVSFHLEVISLQRLDICKITCSISQKCFVLSRFCKMLLVFSAFTGTVPTGAHQSKWQSRKPWRGCSVN